MSPSEMPIGRIERIERAVFRAIDEINEARAREQRLEKSSDTVLMGESGRLDSLGLVNLVVAVEEQVAEEFGVTINIADTRARLQTANPYQTVSSLVEYIASILARDPNG
jgi:acyl carrier protein